MASFLAIINPAAGGGRSGKEAPAAIALLRSRGLEVDVIETRAAGEARQYAREAYLSGRRHFISIGGDGTGFEVINGILPLSSAADHRETPTIGFIPLGTGNSFLRDFTSNGADYSMDALLQKKSRPCDVLQLISKNRETIFFINILSIGFVADVCVTRNRLFKSYGEAGYVMSVFKELKNLKPRHLPMRLDDQKEVDEPVTFIAVSNSRFTGGKMMMAPQADTCDGRADLIRVGKMGRWELLKAFPRIFRGTHTELSSVNSAKVRTIDFEMEGEVNVMVDGETFRFQPHRLDVLKGAFHACA